MIPEFVFLSMPYIFMVVFGIVAIGAPSWRSTALIIFGFSAFNVFMLPFYQAVETHESASILFPTISGAVDFFTAVILVTWGSVGMLRQAKALCLALMAHIVMIVIHIDVLEQLIESVYDITTFEDAYMMAIFAVNIAQLWIMGGSRHELIGTVSRIVALYHTGLSTGRHYWRGLRVYRHKNMESDRRASAREGRI